MSFIKKNKNIIISFSVSIILILFCIFSVKWASAHPEKVLAYYAPFSQTITGAISSFSALLPFSLGEFLIYTAILAVLVSLVMLIIRLIKCDRRVYIILAWFSKILLIGVILVTIFLIIWGYNNFLPSASERLSLNVQERPLSDLTAMTEYFAEQLNHYGALVERDENNIAKLGDFNEISDMVVSSANAASTEYTIIRTTDNASLKHFTFSGVLAKLGLSGIYIPFTAESNMSSEEISAMQPYTLAHELSHQMGIALEDEANFAAFLICRDSEYPELNYSGYLTTFIYCYNAIYKRDRDAALEFWDLLSNEVKADIYANNDNVRKNEGAVSKVSEKVNDTYLKLMDQEKGIDSYGAVVDLLLAEYYR